VSNEARRKRLAQLRRAYASGLLDEDTYRAAVAGLGVGPEVALEGDGARSLGPGLLSVVSATNPAAS
jgi:hypothetical protein